MKQLNPNTNSNTEKMESRKTQTSPDTGNTAPESWQKSWIEAAQKESPAKRNFMEEALRRYQELYPEDSDL